MVKKWIFAIFLIWEWVCGLNREDLRGFGSWGYEGKGNGRDWCVMRLRLINGSILLIID